MTSPSSSISLMVLREVGSDLTALVAALDEARGATAGHSLPRGGTRLVINDLTEQAEALSAPVLDYEATARSEGWKPHDIQGYFVDPADGSATLCNDWKEACQIDALEPKKLPILEHRAVSPWLAKKLTRRGERVDTGFAGLSIWARTRNSPPEADPLLIDIALEGAPK